MRPNTLAQTGVGNSSALPLDIHKNPFNVGIGVVTSGTVTYTVQYTFNETDWFDHPNLTNKTAKAESNIAFPVKQVRVSVTAGSGTATATVIQAGSGV